MLDDADLVALCKVCGEPVSKYELRHNDGRCDDCARDMVIVDDEQSED